MNQDIVKLDHLLSKLYPNYYAEFAPGLTRDQIAGFCSLNNLKFTEKHLSLYEWKNGVLNYDENDRDKLALFEFGIFLPLEDSYIEYQRISIEKQLWPSMYYPVFASGIGDYYLVKLFEKGQNDEFVYFYSPALLIVEPAPIFDSIQTLFTSLFEAYSTNILKRDKNNELLELSDKYNALMKKMNPNSIMWR